MGARLGQQGADVQGDLGGELSAAIDSGGPMGDMTAVNSNLEKFQQRYNQYMLGRQRAGQARQVDAMFADPRRENGRKQQLAADRRLGQGQIAEGYRVGRRENAFSQARRGTLGSSMDVEQQGDLARGRDAAAMGLESGLSAREQQYRLGDAQQRNTLMGLIYSDDPSTAASFQRTLEGIGDQGQMVQESEAQRAQRDAQRRATATGYSQIFGGLLTSGSGMVGNAVEYAGGA